MKENKLNSLEQKLNEKLNQASFEFQESNWAEMEGKLAKKGGLLSSSKWIKMTAILLIGAAGIYYLYDSKESGVPNNVVKEDSINKEIKQNEILPSEKVESVSEINKVNTDNSNNTKKSTKVKSSNSENKIDSDLTEELDETDETITEAKEDVEILFAEENEGEVLIEELITNGNLCIGSILKFTAITNFENTDNLVWKVNDIELDNSTNEFNLAIENEGTFKIEVISSTGNSQSTSIEVYNAPEINFTYEDLADPFWDEAAILKADPLLDNYTWEIEGMDNPILGNNQTVDFDSPGFYDVELIYTDENGCETSISKPIQIQQNFDPLAPNAFTTDGDGLNDVFIPQGFYDLDADFRMSIFDIKGNLVYTTTSVHEPWKGEEINNNSDLSPNMYVWKVEITKDNRTKAFTGQVQQYKGFE